MNSDRRASSGSGTTSVWVGSRPKSPVHLPTKVTNHTLHSHTNEQSNSGTEGGEYVVVSFTDSTSNTIPSGRKNSTGVLPSSINRQNSTGVLPSSINRQNSTGVLPSSINRQNSTGVLPSSINRKNSTGVLPSSINRKNSTGVLPSSIKRQNSTDLPSFSNRKNSTGVTPLSTSRKNSASSPFPSSNRKNSAVSPLPPLSSAKNNADIYSLSNTFSACQAFTNTGHTANGNNDFFSPFSPVGSVPLQPTSSLNNSWAGNNNLLLANGLSNPGNFIPTVATGLGVTSTNNVLGNISSLVGGNNAANMLANSGFGVANNFLANSLSSTVTGNLGSLYGGGSFLPGTVPYLPLLPPVSPGFSSLLFQQQYGLTPEALAASLDETLSLTKATSLMLPQTLTDTSSHLDLSQPLFSSLPSVQPSVDILPASLPTSQTLLSPDLQFPSLFSTPTLPQNTTGIFPAQTSVAPFSQNTTHTKPPPPLLDQNPSKTYHSRRSALKARESSCDRKSILKRPALQKSRSVDQADHYQYQTTSEIGSSVPTVPSRSFSSSPLGSVHDMQGWEQEVHSPVLTIQPCYEPPEDPQCCMRCGKKVYNMEKQVGPVRRVLYHQVCFTCAVCRTALALHSYYLNDADKDDLNVYCASHKPVVRHNPLDSDALVFQQSVLLFGKPDGNGVCDDEE